MRRVINLKRIVWTGLTAAAALIVPFSGRPALSAEPAANIADFEKQLTAVIAQAEPAVVVVSRLHAAADPASPETEGLFDNLPNNDQPAAPPAHADGLGVVIDPAGYVLTSILNVAAEDEHRLVWADGRELPAKLLAADPRSALAVLKVDANNLPALELGEAEKLRKGQFVIAFGNPAGLRADGQASASWGAITNLGKKAEATENLNNYANEQGYRTTLHHFGALIQTDARLGWSASGGPLVALDGKLVGLCTTAAATAGHEEPARYAIPINATYRRVIEALKAGKEAEYGLLGIGFMPEGMGGQVVIMPGVDPGLPAAAQAARTDGVSVNRVYPGGAADRAGLQPNDILTEINGQKLTSTDDLQLLVGEIPPGQPAEVAFVRAGTPQLVKVVLDKNFVSGPKVVTAKTEAWRGIRVDFPTAAPLAVLDQNATSGLIDPAGCVLVAEVEPGSLAERAGVQPNRFISAVNSERVQNPRQFIAAVSEITGEATLTFTTPKPVAPQLALQFQPGIVFPQPVAPVVEVNQPETIVVPAE